MPMTNRYTVERISELVDEILHSEGYTRYFPVKISKRMTTTLGWVKSIRSLGTASIMEMKFSAELLDKGTDEHVLDIIKHECAHAILIMRDPHTDHGHDAEFVRECNRLQCKSTGRHIAYRELMEQDTEEKPPRYQVYCKHCNTLVLSRYNYSTKVDDLLHGRRYHCNGCGLKDFELR